MPVSGADHDVTVRMKKSLCCSVGNSFFTALRTVQNTSFPLALRPEIVITIHAVKTAPLSCSIS
jgi:hypothetical protein